MVRGEERQTQRCQWALPHTLSPSPPFGHTDEEQPQDHKQIFGSEPAEAVLMQRQQISVACFFLLWYLLQHLLVPFFQIALKATRVRTQELVSELFCDPKTHWFGPLLPQFLLQVSWSATFSELVRSFPFIQLFFFFSCISVVLMLSSQRPSTLISVFILRHFIILLVYYEGKVPSTIF